MKTKEELFNYIKEEESVSGYSGAYRLVLYKILFSDLWDNKRSYAEDIAVRFQRFYFSRINEGKIADKDVDDCIIKANSSIDDVLDLIKTKPYKHINANGFLEILQDEKGEYFAFPKEILDTLTKHDVFRLMTFIYKQVNSCFSKIAYGAKKEINTFSLPQLGEREQEFAQIVNGIKAKFAKLNSDSIIDNILDSKEEYETICKTISVILSWKRINYITTFQKELMALFLVGTAKYYYNDGEGGFWNQVEKIIPQINGSNYRDVINAFNAVIKKYNLPAFKEEQSEGFKLITPIICHAGIPINCLDSWFDVVFQLKGVKYSNIENELDYACRYANKPVIRYVKFLSGRAILADEVQQLQELLECALSKQDIPECSEFSYETRTAAVKWAKNKAKTVATLQRFAAPELVLDPETFSLNVHLPKMKLNDESSILWEIKAGSKTITKKEYGRAIDNGYFYNDYEILINPEPVISVKLIGTNGVLDEFCLKSEKDYLVFNNNGKQNKSRFIPKKQCYFICNYDVKVSDNLQVVYEYDEYIVYANNPQESNEVWLENNSDKTFYVVKEKPELIGGNFVFNGSADFEDIDAYYRLPQIAIPFDGEWQITMSKDSGERIDTVVFAEEEICIENVIKEEWANVDYGVYKIRLKHDKCGYSSFKFAYLPNCSLVKRGFFPNEEGYEISRLEFNCSSKAFVTANNQLVSEIIIPVTESIFEGCLCYEQLSIPFHVHLKAFTWEIFNEDKSFGSDNKKAYISSNDLLKSQWVMLNIRNHTFNAYTVEIYCGERYSKRYTLGSNKKFSFNLKELIEAVLSSDETYSAISIQVTNQLKFPVCCIRKEIHIRNLTGRRDHENNLSFCWNEDGSLTDRELVVANLVLPYKSKTYPILDSETRVTVDVSDFDQSENYFVFVQHSKFNSSSIYEVIEEKKRVQQVNGICFGKKQRLPKVKEYYEEIIDREKPSFEEMIYSYLLTSFNDYGVDLKEEKGLIASVYREKIIEYRVRYGDAEFYKTLFNYDLDEGGWIDCLNDLALTMPCFLPDKVLNDDDEKTLKEKNMMAYVQYLSATKQIEKIIEAIRLISEMKDEEVFALSKADLIFPAYSSDSGVLNSVREWENTFIKHKRPTESEALLYTMVDIILDGLNLRENRVNTKYSNAVNLIYTKYKKTLLEAFIRRVAR